jgi:hypothetical protein
MSHKDNNHFASTQRFESKFVARLMRIGGAAFVGASIFLPAQVLFASTYDGQGVHLNSGESVQIDCASGQESTAQLDQFGNTRYYSLRCIGGSNTSGSPAPTVVENSSSKTTVHLDRGGSVHIVCYGGSANLNTAGNTRYYALSCNQ